MNTASVIKGVSTIINEVSFQLTNHRKIRLPMNCRKFLMSMERLSEHTEYTVEMSFPSLESSYPDLFESQQVISFSSNVLNNSHLISTMTFSPSKLKLYPLIPEDIAITMVNTMNLSEFSVRSPAYRIVSTISPQRQGRNTMPKEDKTKVMFAIRSNLLFFQVQRKSLLNVLTASLAFLLAFGSFFYYYIKEALVLVVSESYFSFSLELEELLIKRPSKVSSSKIYLSFFFINKIISKQQTVSTASGERNKTLQALTKSQLKLNSLAQTLNEQKMRAMDKGRSKQDDLVDSNKKQQKQINELSLAIEKRMQQIDVLKNKKYIQFLRRIQVLPK